MTREQLTSHVHTRRLRLKVAGNVQGVGFRPHVYRIARQLGLAGWVANTPEGADIEIEGPSSAVTAFEHRFRSELPPLASVTSCERVELAPTGQRDFVIRTSASEGQPLALVLPDIATCSACRQEIFDPHDRRYRYPFTNCTNCGPRYTIIRRLPYDRANTTMAHFEMCSRCRAEYENPADRRFHAQPNACPHCGPQLAWLDARGRQLARGEDALQHALKTLSQGGIVALKGIGGFQLLVDAADDAAVRRLRTRKRREEKPFALMVPSLRQAYALCRVSALERELLESPQSPIVLLERRDVPELTVASSVAPGNPSLGLMVPYSPIHHLLMHDFARPIVATSGNMSDEPICTRTRDALTRLAGIADGFLTHDRPIERYVDDSVVRVVAGRVVILRRARGYAPQPVARLDECPPHARTIIAFGSHLKNTIAVTVGPHIVLSQHIGDLDTEPAVEAHDTTARALLDLYRVAPERIACDLHPDYASTRSAERWARARAPLVPVPHHFAHIAAVMAEHELGHEPVLGVAWDGTGLGLDGTIWGGEFLRARRAGFERLGHFRWFRALGGDRAMREPRRSALAVLAEILGPDEAQKWFDAHAPESFAPREKPLLRRMLQAGTNSPWTTSAGRLFDAVAALLRLRTVATYEGQAAMALEWCAATCTVHPEPYPIGWRQRLAPTREAQWPWEPAVDSSPHPIAVFDWEPMVRAILEDLNSGRPPALIAARFHVTLAEVVVQAALRAAHRTVVLAGGCFQNRLLTERCVSRLEQEGYVPVIAERVPPNDGGLAVGQIVAAAHSQVEESPSCA